MLKKTIALFILLILLLTALFVPACKKKAAEGVLPARFIGSDLCWDSRPDAANYQVTCTLSDGSGYTISLKETSYKAPFTAPGDYVFYVSAKNAEGKVVARSSSLFYHLGTGKAADAVLIGSADDLLAIKTSSTTVFGKTKTETPVYYRLTADIDLTGKEFEPIGTSSAPFRGVFDGAGYAIKGLTITKCNTDGNVGLFGQTDNALIKNVILKDASIRFDKNSETKKGELNCGLLVGHAVSSNVSNCRVTGEISILPDVITTDSYTLSAGGVVGKAESGRVAGVSFDGKIFAQYGRAYAGGIAGFALGTDPDFMLLNAKSVADVSAVGTSYSTSTGTSSAYARAGVLIGNLSHAGRLSSLLAIGKAKASSTKDGTPISNLTAGVIGRAKVESTTVVIPIFNLYYSDTIEKVAGNATSLGSYARSVYPLSEDAMKDKNSYLLEDKYGLDFDAYWDLPAGNVPELRAVKAIDGSMTATPPSLSLSVISEVKDKTFSYDFYLEDVMLPSHADIALDKTVRMLGYKLNTLLEKLGASLSSLYTEKEIENGVSLKIAAEGMDDLIVTTKRSSSKIYLECALYSVYESPADVFGGVKIIDAASLKTYDYTTAKHITITLLPAESQEA